jgi:hypothetical protein
MLSRWVFQPLVAPGFSLQRNHALAPTMSVQSGSRKRLLCTYMWFAKDCFLWKLCATTGRVMISGHSL